MDWIEYVRVLQEFRTRFGRMPPSILTEDGAFDQIRAALDEPSAERRAAARKPNAAARQVGQPDAPRRRERGH